MSARQTNVFKQAVPASFPWWLRHGTKTSETTHGHLPTFTTCHKDTHHRINDRRTCTDIPHKLQQQLDNFTVNNKRFKLIGIKLSNRKYPIIGMDEDGRKHKFEPGVLDSLLAAN